jgi:hypothetical protein
MHFTRVPRVRKRICENKSLLHAKPGHFLLGKWLANPCGGKKITTLAKPSSL